MKKLSVKEKYRLLTRDLDWEYSYFDQTKVYPFEEFEGIKIVDWDKWEDPFKMTMDAYWKYQAEKEKKLYAILDAFSQNNSQLNVSDPKYLNAIKIFLTAISPQEYQAGIGFAHAGRQLSGVGARVACQMQAIDELRHVQTQIHAMSHYNKHFNGFSNFADMQDKTWYLSVPVSFFHDARTSGPFEFLLAIGFSFEYVLTNLLFVPFMSGAAHNSDMATVTFGFSAQSDEARHMTLGLEVIKFLLEQHEDNVPIVQRFLDKWFWRGTRLLSVVAMMMDYMLPKKVMSWAEAWGVYFEEAGGALFKDLARYGIRPPKYADKIKKEKNHVSHQAWWTFYQYGHASGFHTWIPTDEELDWLSAKYPETFDKYYRPRWELAKKMEEEGKRFYSEALPQLCQVCQLPMIFTEMDEPTKTSSRQTVYNEENYHFCSDGCKDIFEHEPEKYVQAWLPIHQIFQGNLGESIEDTLENYFKIPKNATGDIQDSEDLKIWKANK